MNRLVRQLISPFLKEQVKAKRVIAIYPGRFQPFGPHHRKVFQNLPSKFRKVYITTSGIKQPPRHPMNFKEKKYVIGVGCERGTDPEIMVKLVKNTLEENGILAEKVAMIVSIDIKADEQAIHTLAERFFEIYGVKCGVRFFDAITLEKQTPRLIKKMQFASFFLGFS